MEVAETQNNSKNDSCSKILSYNAILKTFLACIDAMKTKKKVETEFSPECS